ncbi:hypothetical protein BU15DRAFT_53502, partial [Melanogaster broomeanus]
PTDHAPPFLRYVERAWDDGMQSWTYLVKDSVSLQHFFTGTQENLQAEATTLLDGIQSDVLLTKEDSHSRFWIFLIA